MEFPLASAEKILKKTNMRVGKDAVKEFTVLLEEIAADFAAEAAASAKREKRKNISEKDIRDAKRKII